MRCDCRAIAQKAATASTPTSHARSQNASVSTAKVGCRNARNCATPTPSNVTYDRRHQRVMSTCLHPSRVRTDSTCDSVFESDYATRAQIAAVHTPQPTCVTSLGCTTACVTSSVMTTPRSTLSRKTMDYAQYMESGSSERSESMRYFALEATTPTPPTSRPEIHKQEAERCKTFASFINLHGDAS